MDTPERDPGPRNARTESAAGGSEGAPAPERSSETSARDMAAPPPVAGGPPHDTAAPGPAPVEAGPQRDTAGPPHDMAAPEPEPTRDTAAPESEPPAPAPPVSGPPAAEPARAPAPPHPLAERPEAIESVPRRRLDARTRRDFLLFAAGALATGIGAWWLLPGRTRSQLLPQPAHDALDTLAARVGLTAEQREKTLDRALTFDDDVAEALYSPDRRVRTYRKSQATPLRNNYNGRTPDPGYVPGWRLRVSGLASGAQASLTVADLLARLEFREQVTRFVCVEGWSAVAWWGGVRFADFLREFAPAPGSRWAALRSAVNLDGAGNPDPYYVSIDLGTATHPQALLATHLDGRPLTVEHGAPLRLLVPMKLGLKNIKAVTDLVFTAREPADYWSERGYSKYDGL
jgi:DMSO/TMAO reductase YedYZ molybdopterin-dependent catalytic subunit